jgi:hypothetical protein
LTDAFEELVAVAVFLGHPQLEFEMVFTSEEEYRRHTPGKAWRRHGWTVIERRLLEVTNSVELRDKRDFAALLPPGLPVLFTTGDLATSLRLSRRLAQQMAYCLRTAGIVEAAGKRGNAVIYRSVSLR